VRLAAAALALGLAVAAHAAPPPLPAAVAAELPALKALGDARFRFFLIHVYDASLWTAGEAYDADRPFVLDIRYAMDVTGADLAKRSIVEMRKQGHADEQKLARWDEAMRRVFPDIRKGDRLVGVYVPGREARFFNQKGLIGSVADAEFARAFFAIWLDARTSEPELRRRLLQLE